MAGRHATETYVDEAVSNATVGPVTDADSSSITEHVGSMVSIATGSWHTIFDLTGAVELLGGGTVGVNAAVRLTVDGVEAISNTSGALGGTLNGDDAISAAGLPTAKASSSMKLEIRNGGGGSRDYGWRVWTR